MSKTRRKTHAKEEQMYSDSNRKNSHAFKRSKEEKRVQNALRSNNVEDLLSFDEYDDWGEY